MVNRSSRAFAPTIVNPLFYALAATTALCLVLWVIRAFQLQFVQYHFLLWNFFLAWLPLIVSMASLKYMRIMKGRNSTPGLLVLGAAWLLLYPNAPYLTTDFIHLIFNPLYAGYDKEGLLLWYDLVLFFLFAWCGLLLGYLSMRHFHDLVAYSVGVLQGWAFILVVSFLGGFGVYLGRVVRLNSWDVLFNPFRLIEGVLEGINPRAAVFSLLFGMLILIVYVTLYLLTVSRAQVSSRTAGEGP
jgi:uncharacterized membrane protein